MVNAPFFGLSVPRRTAKRAIVITHGVESALYKTRYNGVRPAEMPCSKSKWCVVVADKCAGRECAKSVTALCLRLRGAHLHVRRTRFIQAIMSTGGAVVPKSSTVCPSLCPESRVCGFHFHKRKRVITFKSHINSHIT